ncbi:hypothetical protein HAX54_022613 [Datura stramonium]|uniref:Uncharacterized protein n=1 Tax=Datura stramonium TaxID=4076 RepID=A0ABS8S595_DATST|nr:hypothetical protein [Datura stramonium]
MYSPTSSHSTSTPSEVSISTQSIANDYAAYESPPSAQRAGKVSMAGQAIEINDEALAVSMLPKTLAILNDCLEITNVCGPACPSCLEDYPVHPVSSRLGQFGLYVRPPAPPILPSVWWKAPRMIMIEEGAIGTTRQSSRYDGIGEGTAPDFHQGG